MQKYKYITGYNKLVPDKEGDVYKASEVNALLGIKKQELEDFEKLITKQLLKLRKGKR